ncbi:hypothetical protein ACLKA7_014916 [Drosophila subpalustris]
MSLERNKRGERENATKAWKCGLPQFAACDRSPDQHEDKDEDENKNEDEDEDNLGAGAAIDAACDTFCCLSRWQRWRHRKCPWPIHTMINQAHVRRQGRMDGQEVHSPQEGVQKTRSRLFKGITRLWKTTRPQDELMARQTQCQLRTRQMG